MRIKGIAVNVMFLFIISCIASIAAQVEPDIKGEAKYHHLCGCNTLFYLNKLEGRPEDSDFHSFPGFAVVTPNFTGIDLPDGSNACNKIEGIGFSNETLIEGLSPMSIDEWVIDCFMKGRYTRLEGYYKLEPGKNALIKAAYKLEGQDPVIMETKKLTGFPYWSKFDYHIDLTELPQDANFVYFNFMASAPYDEENSRMVPLYIDEITMCQYCDGELSEPLPALISLDPSIGELQPSFQHENPYYTLSVPSAASLLTLTPQVDPLFAGAEIYIDDNLVPSGQASAPIGVSSETNISILVKNEQEPCKRSMYSINVERLEPLSADLLGLSLSEGYLETSFSSEMYTYAGIIPLGVTEIEVMPNAKDPNAEITVDGLPVASSEWSQTIAVELGTVITVEITSPDDLETQTYTITIEYEKPKIQFETTPIYAPESQPTVAVPVVAHPGATTNITVTYEIIDGTAVNGTDYTGSNGTITLTTGQTEPTNILIDLLDDNIAEDTEIFYVKITAVAPVADVKMGFPLICAVHILNDDCVCSSRRYVNLTADPGGNGCCWATAYTTINEALFEAKNSDGEITEIWVAEGTYKPTDVAQNRYASFQLINGVSIYGGFAGTETELLQRDLNTHETILNGDIDNNSLLDNGNSLHIITADGIETAIVDGFTITGGYADIIDLDNSGNNISFGGGLYSKNSSLTISNCKFSSNYAVEFGGGLFADGGAVTINSSEFSQNNTFNAGDVHRGSAIYTQNSELTMDKILFYENNCFQGTVYGNNSDISINNPVFIANNATSASTMRTVGGTLTMHHATIVNNGDGSGSLMLFTDGIVAVTNSNVWFNTGDIIAEGAAALSIDYNNIESGAFAGAGTNISADPQFASSPAIPNSIADISLQIISPSVNAGTDVGVTSDYLGNPRPRGSSVDIGAIEIESYTPPAILYVNVDAAGENTGTDWLNAFTDLNDALIIAQTYSGTVSEVRVADGIYRPTSGSDRTASFIIPDNLTVSGGYVGEGASPDVRDWITYQTILSGDIGVAGSGSDNSHTIVTAGSDITVDGFIIQDAVTLHNELSTISWNQDYCGGGLYAASGTNAIVVQNCVFRNNSADVGAGAVCSANQASFINCSFENNSSYHSSGALYSMGSQCTFTKCTFSNNNAIRGGAIFFEVVSSADFIKCFFDGNSATGDAGGALNILSNGPLADAAQISFTNSVFLNNTSVDNSGGAIQDYNSSIMINSCTFSGNTAMGSTWGNGGAISVAGADFTPLTIVNSLFWYNNAALSGLDVYISGQVNSTISNSNMQTVSYDGINGNISSDPLFINAPAVPSSILDLALGIVSPCINAGSIVAVSDDYNGNPRPQGGGYDMGAFESNVQTYELTVQTPVYGTVDPMTATYYVGGDPITITATADNNYAFDIWSVVSGNAIFAPGTETDPLTTVTLNSDATIAATFIEDVPVYTIMPLGDSNTRNKWAFSYRPYLKHYLAQAGYVTNFVGSTTEWQETPDPLMTTYMAGDEEHEGHGGWKINDLNTFIDYEAHPADYILLMIGTNDVLQDTDLANASQRLRTLLSTIYNSTAQQDAYVLVSTIIPCLKNANDPAQAVAYNAEIPDIVLDWVRGGHRVSLVDNYNVITPDNLAQDGIHPDGPGFDNIAQNWRDHLLCPIGGNNPAAAVMKSPAADAVFNSDDDILFAVDAADVDGSIASVEIYAGGSKIGDAQYNEQTWHWEFSWNSASIGTHSVSARVLDNAGCVTNTIPRNMTVIDNNSVVVRAINVGGPAIPDGSNGINFEADNSGSGGGVVDDFANTIIGTIYPESVYQTVRHTDSDAQFSYNISIPNGDYTVELLFADQWRTAVGTRVMDVAIEGTMILDNYDVFAAVGQNAADHRIFSTVVSDGSLDIVFSDVTSNALVSGIIVRTPQDFNVVYADPVNGDNANDGSSWAQAKEDIFTHQYTVGLSAMDVAEDGDEIWVRSGTFEVFGNDATINKSVIIRGGYSGVDSDRNPDPATNNSVLSIYGDNQQLVIPGGLNITFDGFTLESSTLNNSIQIQNGAGQVTFLNVEYRELRLINGANVQFINSTLSDLPGDYSASCSMFPSLENSGNLFIINSDVVSNDGQLIWSTGNLKCMNSTVTGNTVRCSYTNAALDLITITGGTAEIVNTLFAGNQATSFFTDFLGGSIINTSVPLTITNSTFTGNRIFEQLGSSYRPGSVIEISSNAAVNIYNSLFWNNMAADGAGTIEKHIGGTTGGLSVAHTAFNSDDGTAYSGTANIHLSSSPFVDEGSWFGPNFSSGDYRLTIGSTPIDAGNNSFIPTDEVDLDNDNDVSEPIPFDRAGNQRVQSSIVDMGAFEGSTISGDFVIKINVGGGAVSDWVADQTWVAGTTDYGYVDENSTTVAGTINIANVDDAIDPVYQSVRYRGFSYNIALTNGDYYVTLVFADSWRCDVSSQSCTDSRIREFTVAIEGIDVTGQPSPLNVVNRVGQTDKNTIYGYDLNAGQITVNDGVMNITLGAVTGDPILSGIIITSNGSIPSGRVIHVKEPANGGSDANSGMSWDGDAMATIYGAVAKAMTLTPTIDEPVEIWVAAGTYAPWVDFQNRINLSPYIHVYGGFPANGGAFAQRNPDTYSTIINGDINGNDGQLASWPPDIYDPLLDDNVGTMVEMGANTTLDGFVLRSGFIHCTQNCGGVFWVPAIYAHGGTNIKISNCKVERNISVGGFGGVVYSYEANVLFENCTFTENYATANGGAFASSTNDAIEFRNCIFNQNNANGGFGRGGGAIYILSGSSGSLTISGSQFNGNGTGQNGAAVFTSNVSLTVDECQFVNGNNSGDGAGIYSYSGIVSVENSTFRGGSNGGHGSGIYIEQPDAESYIFGCTFENNGCGGNGGAIYHYNSGYTLRIVNSYFVLNNTGTYGGGALYHNGSTPGVTTRIINSVFAQNTCPTNGSAIVNEGLGNMLILSSTFHGNDAGNPSGVVIENKTGANLSISSSIMWGNEGGNSNPVIFDENNPTQVIVQYSHIQGGYTGEENYNEDPIFVDPSDPLNGGLSLQAATPCKNNGRTNYPINTYPQNDNGDDIDIIGNLRFQHVVIDRGAYETPYSSGNPGVEVRVNCGGVEYTDGSRNVWEADSYGSGGQPGTYTTDILPGNNDQLFYQLRHSGSDSNHRFSYSFDNIKVPNGTYTVNFYFAEQWRNPGERQFYIDIEGSRVAAANPYDIRAHAAMDTECVLTTTATVSDGNGMQIDFIDLNSVNDNNAMVSGIEIISQ